MAPPTGNEQLIRDYLNRMSVAARDLAPDDRRALLERTRSLIEQKADLSRRPSTMDVGRVLARLGDPARLVEQERRRLASQARSAHSGTPATSEMPARQRFLGRALGRELGRLRGPSFRWPTQLDSREGAALPPSNGLANGIHQPKPPTEGDSRTAAAVSAEPPAAAESHAERSPPAPASSPPAPQASATVAADGPAGAATELPASSPPAANGAAHATSAPPSSQLPKRQPGSSGARPGSEATGAVLKPSAAAGPASGTDGESRGSGSQPDSPAVSKSRSAGQRAAAAAAPAAPSGPDTAGDRTADPGGRPPDSPRSEDRRRRHEGAIAPMGGSVNRRLGPVLAWARKRPLEAAAIVVMGIGGPIFPPVFLIGGTLALASELWDGRDKWVGLALPVVLTVIGLAVGIAAGGRAHWVHESWVYLDVVSRVAPALGAAYLAWRSQQPRRPSAVPPFSTPRRVS